MELKFVNTQFNNIVYKQFKNDFVNGLSFIDVLMFNPIPDIHYFLKQYKLIDN